MDLLNPNFQALHDFARNIQKDFAKDFFVRFETGYNEWEFDSFSKTLRVECKRATKIGPWYVLKIKEVT
jgi:hypothetical protein